MMKNLLLILICVVLAGCFVEDFRETIEIKNFIVKGKTTKQEVLDTLGEPTNRTKLPTFNLPESTWRYMSFDKKDLPPKLRGGELWSYTKIKSKKGFFIHAIKSTYLMIFFDIDGVVSDYSINRSSSRY